MNKFDLNYCNSEYSERHKGGSGDVNRPKQMPLEWHKWGDLFDFFRGYFEHFGDDISGIDEKTFERMVKTIWRFSNVVAFREGMKYQKEMTPSFREQLQDWFKDIQRHNESEMDETFHDIITPNDIFYGVLGNKHYSEDVRQL